MDADAELASAAGTAVGAAVVAKAGIKVSSRGGLGGYNRISGSTVQWVEVGDTLPGQPIYDVAVPFFPSPTSKTDITIFGGRSFSHVVTVDIEGVTDITQAVFAAQVRANNPFGHMLATMDYQITGPLTVEFLLNPQQTQSATAAGIRHGVWDAEMHLNGVEVTIVPQSKVTLVQGVSQADDAYPCLGGRAAGVAFNAEVLVA
jgi:hypothetical protein